MPFNPPLNDWQGKRVWIVGASSGIGRATATALHARGAEVWLSARDAPALNAFCAVHPGCIALALDVTDGAAVQAAAHSILKAGPLDLMLYSAGYYKALDARQFDLAEMLAHQQVNYVGALYVLNALIPHFMARKMGHISLIGSVAGYRGLPKSLAYGPTKAALINLAETLYSDLHASGVGVSLINPGFVATALTAQNQFVMPALISPAEAAKEILAGWGKGTFEIHFPKRFTRWLKLLRILPYAAYFRAIHKLKAS